MYLGDPREQAIDLDNHTIWEEDNRVEERWQWNAMILDLCNLSPEEYAQTIFYVKTAPTSKTRNVITLTFAESSAKFTYPYAPASDVYVVITDSEGNKEVITIPTGDASPFTALLQNVDPTKVTTVTIGPSESAAKTTSFSDDVYDYSIIKRSTPTDFVKFAVMKHTAVEDGLTEEEIVGAGLNEATVDDKSATFEYILKPVAIEGFNDMDEEEFEEIMEKEQIDLLLFTSSKAKSIYLNTTDEQTHAWNLNYTTVSLGGNSYYVTRFVQENLVNIYDPIYETPRDINFLYKITME